VLVVQQLYDVRALVKIAYADDLVASLNDVNVLHSSVCLGILAGSADCYSPYDQRID